VIPRSQSQLKEVHALHARSGAHLAPAQPRHRKPTSAGRPKIQGFSSTAAPSFQAITHKGLPSTETIGCRSARSIPTTGNTDGPAIFPPLLEVARDKKIAWSFRDFETLGNYTSAIYTLDRLDEVVRKRSGERLFGPAS